MNFKAIQDECITVDGARFAETMRASVKQWINDRYAEVWGLDNWTFKQASTTVTVTAGSPTVGGLPSDFGPVRGLWRDDGTQLDYLRARDFDDLYLTDTSTSTPDNYTIIGSQLLVRPTPSASGTYTLLYDKRVTPLSADGDVPALPPEYHYMLVHGAIASGSIMVNDFTYQFAEQRWQNAIQAMRAAYLNEQRGRNVQWGSIY